MSRPEHPGVPLPAECIRDLRNRQEMYDRDPKAYELAEQQREEELAAQAEAEERAKGEWEQQQAEEADAQAEFEASQCDECPF